MPTGNYGTAELRTEGNHDIAAYWDHSEKFAGVKSFIVGENEFLPDNLGIVWNPVKEPGMALTIGGARGGKGAGTLIPALVGYSGSCVVLDVKGELAWITAERRRRLHQRVVILDPFDEVNRSFGSLAGVVEIITKYNPLAALDPNSASFADDVAAIAEALVYHQGGGDQFFTGFARDLFSGLIAAVVQESPGSATLGDAKDFLNMSGAPGEVRKLGTETIYLDGLALLCEYICLKYPGSVAARKLQTFTKSTKPNDSAVVTLKEQLAFLDSDEMRQFLQTDKNRFSFAELAKGKVTVYVVLPGSHQETHSRFLRLCLAQGVRYIQRNRPPLTSPIAFFIDEMGTSLGTMPMIEKSWGRDAGLGILLWGFLQDLTQLERDYPKSWQTFVANSRMIQVLSCRDPFTSNFFSDYLGKVTVKTITAGSSHSSSQGTNQGFSSGKGDSSGQGSSTGGGSYGQSQSSSSSSNSSHSTNEGRSSGTSTTSGSSHSQNYGEIGKPILDPDQIRRMGEDKVLVIFPGQIPYQLQRLEYFTDGRFFGKYRPDPHYEKPKPGGSKPPKQRNPIIVAREAAQKSAEETKARLQREEAARETARQRQAAVAAQEERQRRERFQQQFRLQVQEAARKRRRTRLVQALVVSAIIAGLWIVHLIPSDQERIQEVRKKISQVPPLPAAITQAISDSETAAGILEDNVPYTFNLTPVKVSKEANGTTTVMCIELISNRHWGKRGEKLNTNQRPYYQNRWFTLQQAGGIWKVMRVKAPPAMWYDMNQLLLFDRQFLDS